MTTIDTLDDWLVLASSLAEDDYHLSSWQHSVEHPEGFHAWFWSSSFKEMEIVTHSEDVYKAIIRFRPK